MVLSATQVRKQDHPEDFTLPHLPDLIGNHILLIFPPKNPNFVSSSSLLLSIFLPWITISTGLVVWQGELSKILNLTKFSLFNASGSSLLLK